MFGQRKRGFDGRAVLERGRDLLHGGRRLVEGIGHRPKRRVNIIDLSDLHLPVAGRLAELRRRRRRIDVRAVAAAAVAGAVVAYFLDPENGKRRRKMGRDRLAGGVRRLGSRSGRLARYTAGHARGMGHVLGGGASRTEPEPNDETIAARVRSEIFRDPEIPKGSVNVNVEWGLVVLRGEVKRPEQVRQLEEEARKVAGVRGVENLVTLEGTR